MLLCRTAVQPLAHVHGAQPCPRLEILPTSTKARAENILRMLLREPLASQSYTPGDDTDLQITSRSRRRLWSKLVFIFLVTLSICKLNWFFSAAVLRKHIV